MKKSKKKGLDQWISNKVSKDLQCKIKGGNSDSVNIGIQDVVIS